MRKDANVMSKAKPETGDWDLVIEPKQPLLDLQLHEISHYKDLVLLLVKRDLTTNYKQTILGPLWFIIQPLMSTILYTFVFGNLARLGTDGIPYILFYYGGSMLWSFFSGCLTDNADTFTSNKALFGKVYFPRLTVPIASIVNNSVKLGIQFATLLAFFAYYLLAKAPIRPSLGILLFPLLVIWIAALGTGLGMIVSSLTTKYRDLRQLLGFGLHLAMYATPIVYPLSQVPEKYAWAFYINPVTAPVELFRVFFYSAGNVPPLMVLTSLGVTVLSLFVGLILFKRTEKSYIDVA
jgi:lipopolysaccharide transport system permease protein